MTVHTLLGGFLGLLLVFRTNSAYSRFWEGRMIWGGVKSDCFDPVKPTAATLVSHIGSTCLTHPPHPPASPTCLAHPPRHAAIVSCCV